MLGPIIFLFIIVPLVVAFVFLIMEIGKSFAPVSESSRRAFIQLHRLHDTKDVHRLLDAYLGRGRRYRAGWALAGIVVYFFASASFTGRVSWGSYLFLPALGGYLVGAIHAEMYNLRPKFRSGGEASLTPRTLSRYTDAAHDPVLLILAAATFVGAVLVSVGSEGRAFAWLIGVLALLAVVAVEVCQRAVALRARPALSPDLEKGDDAIRRSSITSLRWAGRALAVVLLCTVFGLSEIPDNIATWVIAYVMIGVSIWLAAKSRRIIFPRLV